jgi:hypothetical protein
MKRKDLIIAIIVIVFMLCLMTAYTPGGKARLVHYTPTAERSESDRSPRDESQAPSRIDGIQATPEPTRSRWIWATVVWDACVEAGGVGCVEWDYIEVPYPAPDEETPVPAYP